MAAPATSVPAIDRDVCAPLPSPSTSSSRLPDAHKRGEHATDAASRSTDALASTADVDAVATASSVSTSVTRATTTVAIADTPAAPDASLCKGEDGYVTPPLRTASVVDGNSHTSQPKQQPSETSAQPPQDATSTVSTASVPPPARNLAHTVGLFTPTLYAAQAPPLRHILSPTSNKRKRIEPSVQHSQSPSSTAVVVAVKSETETSSASESTAPLKPKAPPRRRKGSSAYLRKGQWTLTEEKFARALIEAFEDGYLPIYNGVRLRGYLAVQLQCDPMRISKKLCGGSVDGKIVPKNYGQKKFKQRKKPQWDHETSTRVLAVLEQRMRDVWAESGIPQPAFLTLATTRTPGSDDSASNGHSFLSVYDDTATGASSSTASLDALSASAAAAASDSAALPIIYLNLKKPKTSATLSGARRPTSVDGDSLQAAYELLKLFRTDDSSSRKGE